MRKFVLLVEHFLLVLQIVPTKEESVRVGEWVQPYTVHPKFRKRKYMRWSDRFSLINMEMKKTTRNYVVREHIVIPRCRDRIIRHCYQPVLTPQCLRFRGSSGADYSAVSSWKSFWKSSTLTDLCSRVTTSLSALANFSLMLRSTKPFTWLRSLSNSAA